MNDRRLNGLTLSEMRRALQAGEVSSVELVEAFRNAWEEDSSNEKPVNGYVEFFADAAQQARKADEARAAGGHGKLLGLPIAVKDNIQIAGRLTTCASNILQGYRAPYSATVIERLEAAGAVFLGRANMDEFAMGSSCEYSCYGAVRNPHDRDRTAGGSSGGSAALVAAKQAPFALGSDTGGSVRLPASFCGVYGLKPSYGTLSRYGLVAFGSSLDQIGFLARSVEDLQLVLSVAAAGVDPRDQTSEKTGFENAGPLRARSLSGLTIGIPGQLVSEAVDPQVLQVFDEFRRWLESAGAKTRVISIPVLDACVAMYYIIAPAEASSNLSRFDGVKYGRRAAGAENLDAMYEKTREEGFGPEVKRRILIGNYVLSSGYYDAYYKKAQGVRALLQQRMDAVFEEVDLLASPTSPTPPFRLGEKVDDPLAMYLTDICTTPANLTKSPALSLPGGRTSDGLPVGVQLTGRRFCEMTLLETAYSWEREHAG
ncbi:MAG: Asp-tRNA(Asn)/Glu-tRNA(Gln) amidotransferase subunit GatA [Spirochaetales bacterium]|nr:Asp-tRNA(Asn)/Glu-tRNA(Gln) amidotransferase subunit GatA [Spirochaetales bacterium]